MNQPPRNLPPVLSVGILAALLLPASGLAAENRDARDLGIATPAEVGMSEEVLQELGTSLEQMIDRGELAGMVSLIARHGKIVHFETAGVQDLEAGTPMTKETIFRIYSMTKPITGVALMTLFDQGKFTLDDPVEKFIPELAGLKVAAADGPDGHPLLEDAHHKMTIRELMSHTGGLTYGLFSRTQVDLLYVKNGVLDPSSTLRDMVVKLGQIPLFKQPGTAWQYSVSADVQGYLVEVLSGQPFDQFLKQRIFGPLGMKDTGFYVAPAHAARLATLYVPDADGKLVGQPVGRYLERPTFLSGGGGLVSTAMDYLRFSQMLSNGGELDGVRILEPATVELMRSNQLPKGIDQVNPMIGNPGNVFGLDFAIVDVPDSKADHPLAKGEYWWYGIGGTFFGIHPVHDLIVVGMLQNRGGGAARKARFLTKRLAYEALLDPVGP